MTGPLIEQADANQARASDPAASAWVSANAGTGKTEVLVKRTLRLLLAGARPESVLCLTYTKTAAAEMQNRLLRDLSAWATLPDAALDARLSKLVGRAPEEADMKRARRLFALTLEARGGLKIHTIHGFCERLLQRFPLEAAVTPRFTVLDERSAGALKDAAFDAVITEAAETPTSALGQALDTIVAVAGEESFRDVVTVVLNKRVILDQMVGQHGGKANWASLEARALKQLLGIEHATAAGLAAELSQVIEDRTLDALIEALSEHGGRSDDQKTEEGLRAAREAAGEARAAAFRQTFLTAAGKPRSRVCNKAFRAAVPSLAHALYNTRDRVADLELKRALLNAAEASSAVLAFADAIHGAYAERKQAQAALDYDDLIIKAGHLLSRAGASAWVLYKIDGGIDHILVDEAQDTNPEQWGIVEALAEEFFAGHGAKGELRTLFAVGDEKQSIYSFQGANPARFGAVGQRFERRASEAGLAWHKVPLTVSFRSTVPVLKAVDDVFARAEAAEGLTFAQETTIEHYAFRQGQAGLVELWDLVVEEKPEPAPAFAPWDEGHSAVRAVDRLCERIASQIADWLDDGTPLASAGRPIEPGDILILVRRRSPFTAPMIRALKNQQIPVAGADRMRLMDQIAVEDLVCLADFLLMPDDDLALATVLKSPLFGLDDDALFALAYGRTGSLWNALKTNAEDPIFSEAAERLSDWLGRADFTPPYEFFATLLGADNQLMRTRMLARLGPEAAEAIDEFLDAALAYDRDAAPSLQGFVDRLRMDDEEIKRDMEQGRNEVRIMTVHAAKGLQAPIVFLPDTSTIPRAQGAQVYAVPRPGRAPDEAPHLIWSPGRPDLEAIADAKAMVRREETDEYHRLLYVAMTRARDRLYICGWQGLKEADATCWYHLVRDGLQGTLSPVDGQEGVFRVERPQEVPIPAPVAAVPGIEPAPLPAWALSPAKAEREPERLAPSRGAPTGALEQPPLGPQALATAQRFARGKLTHALLQYLPEVAPENQGRATEVFLSARGRDLPTDLLDEIAAEAHAIVRDAAFAPLFQPGSLAEVPVVARIGTGDEAFEVSGQIDRLAMVDGALLILDYKTNRPPPADPDGVAQAYVAQLAEYRLALSELFPGRPLRAALLWTDGPRLMEISSTLLDDAERRLLGRYATLTP